VLQARHPRATRRAGASALRKGLEASCIVAATSAFRFQPRALLLAMPKSSDNLPQWEPATTRRDALNQEAGFSARTAIPAPIAPYASSQPPPPGRLRVAWNTFWAVFFFSVICAILGVTVNSNLRIRKLPDLINGVATTTAASSSTAALGLPAPLVGASWNDVLARARVRPALCHSTRLRRCGACRARWPAHGLCASLAQLPYPAAVPYPTAQGTTVRFASWSDAASTPPLINNYIDNTLGAAVQAAYGITMRRIPLAATSDAVFSVTTAARSGATGDIDLIWINGKNFKARATRAAPRSM